MLIFSFNGFIFLTQYEYTTKYYPILTNPTLSPIIALEVIGMQKKPQKYVRVPLSLELYDQIKSFAADDFRTMPAEIRHLLKFYAAFRKENEVHRTKGL